MGLVLTRRVGECIQLHVTDGNVDDPKVIHVAHVQVTFTGHDRVKVHIVAPTEIRVVRSELDGAFPAPLEFAKGGAA